MIKVSIPGKIHLIGEHSVVYSKPAILASINLYIRAKISKSKSKQILGLVQYDDALQKMQNAIEKKIQEKFKLKEILGYKIEIDKSGIPVGSGLGTSASLSAAFTICLLKFLKLEYKNDDVFEIALEGEKIFHGNPSGGDLAAVLNKGLIYFKKDKDQKVKITPLKSKVSENVKNLFLIDSGKPIETTAEMVAMVSSKYKVASSKLEKIFESQEKLTKDMLQVLKSGDQKGFFEIIKKAEENLEKLGVVGKTAKAIIRKIEDLGGAAKISGAGGVKGGSGMILAIHKDPNILIKFAKKRKLEYYSIKI